MADQRTQDPNSFKIERWLNYLGVEVRGKFTVAICAVCAVCVVGIVGVVVVMKPTEVCDVLPSTVSHWEQKIYDDPRRD